MVQVNSTKASNCLQHTDRKSMILSSKARARVMQVKGLGADFRRYLLCMALHSSGPSIHMENHRAEDKTTLKLPILTFTVGLSGT